MAAAKGRNETGINKSKARGISAKRVTKRGRQSRAATTAPKRRGRKVVKQSSARTGKRANRSSRAKPRGRAATRRKPAGRRARSRAGRPKTTQRAAGRRKSTGSRSTAGRKTNRRAATRRKPAGSRGRSRAAGARKRSATGRRKSAGSRARTESRGSSKGSRRAKTRKTKQRKTEKAVAKRGRGVQKRTAATKKPRAARPAKKTRKPRAAKGASRSRTPPRNSNKTVTWKLGRPGHFKNDASDEDLRRASDNGMPVVEYERRHRSTRNKPRAEPLRAEPPLPPRYWRHCNDEEEDPDYRPNGNDNDMSSDDEDDADYSPHDDKMYGQNIF